MVPFPIQYLKPGQDVRDLLFELLDTSPDECWVTTNTRGYLVRYRYREVWGSFQVIKEKGDKMNEKL